MRSLAPALLAPLLVSALLSAGCAHGPSAKDLETAEIHYNLGTDALRNGRPQEAMKEYDEALKLDDVFADAHMGRGLVLEFSFDKAAEAEKEYRRAIELRPTFAEAHNNLGQLLAKTGRLQEAVAEFDAALANMLYKEPYVARCNRGQTLYRLGKREEAMSDFRACLGNSPRYCQGHRQLGLIQLGEGRTKEALEQLGDYAKYCDRSADAFLQLGLAQLRAGNAQAAREAFSKCDSLGGDGDVGAECRRRQEALR
jgi:type IV pilus biogenesis/stability protein PilW